MTPLLPTTPCILATGKNKRLSPYSVMNVHVIISNTQSQSMPMVLTKLSNTLIQNEITT